MGWGCPIPLCSAGLCIYLRVGKGPGYNCGKVESHHGLLNALPAFNMAMHWGHLPPHPQDRNAELGAGDKEEKR